MRTYFYEFSLSPCEALLGPSMRSVLIITRCNAPCVPCRAARRVLCSNCIGRERNAHAGHGKRSSHAGALSDYTRSRSLLGDDMRR